MDKLEYIPGDLVYIHGSLRIISNCDGYYATYYDENESLQEVNVNVIEGIPITPEILEKNGWEKDTHRYCLDGMSAEAYEKKDFPLAYFDVTFGKKRILASHDCLFVRNLKYVSDLQHLLFGLGINHEMEV